MAARPYWSGQIRLALVSIPVEVYSATKTGAKISFHQIHEPTGKRIRYEKVVEGIGPVDRDEIVKGYEVSKDNYVLLDPEEIDAVRIESTKTLDLVQFVDAGDIDVFYFEKPYYVVPSDDLAEEAFVVLREALREARKVALGQIALRGRETLVSLKPCGNGIVMESLRYEDEVRQAQSYFEEIPDTKPKRDLLNLAKTLIDEKSAPFDAGEFHDRYTEALENLIERKIKAKGKKVVEEPEGEEIAAEGSNVIDLMAALKRSVGDKPSGKQATSTKASSSKSSSSKSSSSKSSSSKSGSGKAGATKTSKTRKRA
ncbi:Ku protein [Altericroceibacterium xinjiangense]|uniref:non-homologous end joining protein Ku n=1 Tax=Altericroceibacterium xinjiangense TaxID=762261 RepID=UPI000F7F2250|nr:Ku protein [Altericroceibacterium xinjiangense]